MQFLSCHAQQAEKQGETNASDSLPKFAYLRVIDTYLVRWKTIFLVEISNVTGITECVNQLFEEFFE